MRAKRKSQKSIFHLTLPHQLDATVSPSRLSPWTLVQLTSTNSSHAADRGFAIRPCW